jgi:hypothetical protein
MSVRVFVASCHRFTRGRGLGQCNKPDDEEHSCDAADHNACDGAAAETVALFGFDDWRLCLPGLKKRHMRWDDLRDGIRSISAFFHSQGVRFHAGERTILLVKIC